jgi:hypothetical protein
MDITLIDKESEFAKLFATRSKWQPTILEFLDADEKFASIKTNDDAEFSRTVSGLTQAINKVARGRIKLRSNKSSGIIGLTKVD